MAGITSESAIYEPVLVSGASSGLGMAVAAAVLRHGGRVLGLCRNEASLGTVRDSGYDGIVVEEPERLPELLKGCYARPAAFVDCSHSRTESLVASLSPADIDRWALQDIALRARYLRTVVRLMLAQRQGRCLFVSSAAVDAPAVGQGFYAAAKAAGEGLYTSVGLEMAAHGITACSLRLGWLDSGRGRDFLADKKELCEHLIPTGHLVGMDEAVSCILFLLSRSSASLNATTLTMDGGFSRAKQKPGTIL
ncbi:MAG: SDR family oxidoreductase [Desulfovibrionaceae bacterium]|nr:SDR family oxidoreductase [Desulfovibrionaceae bacterium]